MTKTPTPVSPTILLDFKKGRIRIHRRTLHLLGNPEYLRLLVNPEEAIIALQICEASDVRAHHNNAERQSFELYSGALLQQLCQCGHWSDSRKYRLNGHLMPKEGTIFFKMEDAVATEHRQIKPTS